MKFPTASALATVLALTILAPAAPAVAHGHDGYEGRGGYGRHENGWRGEREWHGNRGRHLGWYPRPSYGPYYGPYSGPPVYYASYPAPNPYYNGWYGYTPYGWAGFYWNGAWYHHRRWSAGVFIYF